MFAVIEKYSRTPFRYGADCCQFVGECVESLTGRNPMEQFDYGSQAEAEAIIASYGGLEAAMRAVLGEPYDGAKTGDVCLLRVNGQELAGVVMGDRAVYRTSKTYLTDIPVERAEVVWCTDG